MSKFVIVKEARENKNNCGVVTLTHSHNLDYKTAKQYAEEYFKFDEKIGMQFTPHMYEDFMRKNGIKFQGIVPKELLYPGSKRYIANKNPDKKPIIPIVLRQFIEKYPKGTYTVTSRGHMFTVKDSVILGTGAEGWRTKIESAWLIQ